MAFDGTNHLVVWADGRSGATSDIYGARVSQSGAVLDPTGIAISTAPNHQFSPNAAFDGSNYLVVWEDIRSGTFDIYASRVSQAGAVLDPAGIAISTAENAQSSPSVAFDGGNYLVAWVDNRSLDRDIYGARVSQEGAVLDQSGHPRVDRSARPVGAKHRLRRHELSRRMGRRALGRRDEADIYASRVSQNGAVLDPLGSRSRPRRTDRGRRGSRSTAPITSSSGRTSAQPSTISTSMVHA